MTYEEFRMLVILRACIGVTNNGLPLAQRQRMPALRIRGMFAEAV